MSYAYSAAVEASLELMAVRGLDPTEAVYARLFQQQPSVQPLFWRDNNGAIKGEMLSRVFEAILDFCGERRYAGHMIGTEMITHEGYDVPREIFTTFFGVVRDTLKDQLGAAWTTDIDHAWTAMLADIAAYAARVPRSDVSQPAFDALRAATA